MPRRANLQVAIQQPEFPDLESQNLSTLRKQWRWAAFGQFFFTFSPVFAMDDITLADIERDLTCNSRQVIPRIMQRLLYTLSYDRKVSLDNWQTYLRKQYLKRDPLANPIGSEPTPSVNHPDGAEPQDIQGEPALKDPSASAIQNNLALNASTVSTCTTASPPPQGTVSETASVDLNATTRQSSVFDQPPLPNGHEEAVQQPSLDWFELPMLSKLESMHTLAEWQFQNPTRLRMIMKSDDENATWRIEPVGYDSKRNAYWYIGTDRLWIQRAPPKVKALKRKRTVSKSPSKTQATVSALVKTTKRPRLSSNHAKSNQATLSSQGSGRHNRAAKDQARLKLDAQAKELAELNRQASQTMSARQLSLRSKAIPSPSKVFGTRASARIRGNPRPKDDDEWQKIPDGWLDEGPSVRNSRSSSRLAMVKTGLELDDGSISDLTELSEETNVSDVVENDEEDEQVEPEPEPEQESTTSEHFVEWETICVTLFDWEHISEQFENATHYTEKALYKTLINDIVPHVIQQLREIDRKRQVEEAITHRKRSARLAVRESEKEESRLVLARKQEDEEKMSRGRRLELRKQREEEDRLKKETDREQRRIARESREESRRAQIALEEANTKTEVEKAAKRPKSSSPRQEHRKAKSHKNITTSETPAGEDWELACEICNKRGTNMDDGTPMMSCGVCSRWQHIQCHDRQDKAHGRPKRNWKSVDFVCASCRAAEQGRYGQPSPLSQQLLPLRNPLPPINSPQVQAYGSYPSTSLLGHGVYSGTSTTPYSLGHRDYPRSNSQHFAGPVSQHLPNLSAHPSLSFSHYQPSQHNFTAINSHKSHYNASQSQPHPPNPSVQQYPPFNQAPNANYYRPPVSSAWNGNSQDSGYIVAQSNHSAVSTTPYRHSPTTHVTPTSNGYSSHEPQTSYTRFSTDPTPQQYNYQTPNR